MAEEPESTCPTELLAAGRRHLAVGDYYLATSTLASACELLAKEHGESGDQCAEAHYWYGKALLGLSREERGVLGDKIPDSGNEDDEEDSDEDNADAENGTQETDDVKAANENGETKAVAEKMEAESTTTNDEPTSSTIADKKEVADEEQPGTSNGEAMDESVLDVDAEDDVDNLQLAWEILDLSRSILERRPDSTRSLLADVYLALGEVALESETYDKAVVDMLKCLDIQKEIYQSDDRRIAETHYQIALANSLASNFEEAITHFKNAANILETRIKTLESPTTEAKTPTDSVHAEIKELKELLPDIQAKIQDMMDCKAETIKKLRETLYPSNGAGSSAQSNGAGSSSGSSATSSAPVTDITHLIKRKRKASETEESAPKRVSS
ncbi:protein HGV2 isoform X2 [Epargyreus clarus]|uniref:protein HGV2 isoform X2 n=1 Tax=Epargyreus clarus TaxID=520877 RepID=UPI003C2AC4EC